MKFIPPFCLFLFATVAAGAAEETHKLTSYAQKPGETVRILATSSVAKGRMKVKKDGVEREQPMTMQRVRYLERLLREDGKTLEYKIVNDTTETNNAFLGGRSSRVASLVGRTAVGFRDSAGQLHLHLEGETPDDTEAIELAELAAYANRSWFPDKPVKVGESWEIEPAFIRHLVLRDLGTTGSIDATMTFQEVAEVDGLQTAVLTFTLQTAAVKEDGSGQEPEATATINAKGTLHVTMETMLDRKLVIEGVLISTNRDGHDLTTSYLPFRTERKIEAKK